MGDKYGANLDLNANQLLNSLFQILASDPGSPQEGRFWYNSTSQKFKWCKAAGVIVDSTDAATLAGQAAAYYLARANHTGTQLANTVSDFDTQVRTNRLDQMAAPTAQVSFNSQKAVNLANGTAPADAVNFAQLEAARQGSRPKAAVDAAMTTNVNISNPGTAIFDDQTLANGEGLLLTGQTTGSENGIYIFNGSGVALTRRDDADVFGELDSGTETYAQGGTANLGVWRQTVELTSFTGQSWLKINGGTTYTSGDGLTESPAGTFNVATASSSRIVIGANDIDLASGVATPGTYRSVTVDTHGRVTGGTNPADRYSALFGDAAATVFTYTAGTHGRAGDQTLLVRVIEVSTGDEILGVAGIASNGTVTLTFAVAPTTNQYRVVIM